MKFFFRIIQQVFFHQLFIPSILILINKLNSSLSIIYFSYFLFACPSFNPALSIHRIIEAQILLLEINFTSYNQCLMYSLMKLQKLLSQLPQSKLVLAFKLLLPNSNTTRTRRCLKWFWQPSQRLFDLITLHLNQV